MHFLRLTEEVNLKILNWMLSKPALPANLIIFVYLCLIPPCSSGEDTSLESHWFNVNSSPYDQSCIYRNFPGFVLNNRMFPFLCSHHLSSHFCFLNCSHGIELIVLLACEYECLCFHFTASLILRKVIKPRSVHKISYFYLHLLC